MGVFRPRKLETVEGDAARGLALHKSAHRSSVSLGGNFEPLGSECDDQELIKVRSILLWDNESFGNPGDGF